jgi:hypothetical protein
MTRTSIEKAAILYIIAVSVVFIWTVYKVLQQMGLA